MTPTTGSDPGTGIPFIETKEHRRFAEFCTAVRRDRYIGVCWGPPGVGKTISARNYANWDVVSHLLDNMRARGRSLPKEALQARTVLYTPTVYNTPKSVDTQVRDSEKRVSWAIDRAINPVSLMDGLDFIPKAENNVELLVIDEADRLKTPSFEQVRDHYDRTGVGLVLIGMPGIDRRLARYPQLYSRVGFVHQYRTLSATEQAFILARHWPHLHLDEPRAAKDYTSTEAVATITRITNGNFRLTSRLIAQIERLLEINHLTTVTSEVVEAARESLVIGTP